jgi:hypothetical protein
MDNIFCPQTVHVLQTCGELVNVTVLGRPYPESQLPTFSWPRDVSEANGLKSESSDALPGPRRVSAWSPSTRLRSERCYAQYRFQTVIV